MGRFESGDKLIYLVKMNKLKLNLIYCQKKRNFKAVVSHFPKHNFLLFFPFNNYHKHEEFLTDQFTAPFGARI